MYVDLANPVQELSNIGLTESLKNIYNNNSPLEHEAKSIVAGPSFIQLLNKLFKIQIAAGDILQWIR